MITNKPNLTYILLISVLILSSCASKTYDWVKINPDKIAKARSAKPYSSNVRKVEVLVNAKYKAENVIYVDNSTQYFSQVNPSSVEKVNNTTVRSKRPIRVNKSTKSVNKYKAENRVVSNSKIAINNEIKQVVVEDKKAMDKLNSGLIMPDKKKEKVENKKPLFEKPIPAKESVQKIESIDTPLTKKNDEALNYDNGLSQLEDQDAELNSREIKDSSLEPISENQIKEEGVKRNSYMWIGLILIIVGLIIGLIFGGLAYFISAVGLVFLLIGYLIKS